MEEELQEYGLSEKEARVYVACLKTGACTANRISELADLRRGTTYDVLESLKEKGLVSQFKKEKKLQFQAIDPRELVSLLKDKQAKIQRVIPELIALRKTIREKSEVRFFKGLKGVFILVNELYKEKEPLLYGSSEKIDAFLSHLPKSFAQRRVEEKIKLRAVFEKSEEVNYRIRDSAVKKVTRIKYLALMKNMPTATFIAGDKVGIVTLEREITGVLIKSEEVSKTQRIIFENYWRQAER